MQLVLRDRLATLLVPAFALAALGVLIDLPPPPAVGSDRPAHAAAPPVDAPPAAGRPYAPASRELPPAAAGRAAAVPALDGGADAPCGADRAPCGGRCVPAPSVPFGCSTGGGVAATADTATAAAPAAGSSPPPRRLGSAGIAHACDCLDGGGGGGGGPSGAWLRWVHVPKTGTSFVSTLWSYSCARRGAVDLRIGPFYKNTTCRECYDFALMERYPLEMYCDTSAFARVYTQHQPTSEGESSGTRTGQRVVGFFRSPSARVVSAFDDHMHANGLDRVAFRALSLKCRRNVTCYANYPGIPGCQTRMLIGLPCAQSAESRNKWKNVSAGTMVASAIRMIEAMAFVGITEEWNESICQFHKIFGGTPRQEQFQNIHRGRKDHTAKDLGDGYRDESDERVYAAALAAFREQVGPKRCYRAVEPDTGRRGGADGACAPMSCAELGNRQCGEWPDGCGGVTVCGVCSPGRDALPDSWRLQCVDGQCVRTCPPWVDAGLWYRGEGRTHAEWVEGLGKIGAPIHGPIVRKGSNTIHYEAAHLEMFSVNASYITPADSVRLCARACLSWDSKHQSFASKFCICGDFPRNYLAKAPTLEDYHNIRDLIPLGKDGKPTTLPEEKPIRASLFNTDSQPRCCPPIEFNPSRGNLATSSYWRRGYINADFFESIDLGCGSHRSCELQGQKRNAEVVVFDPRSHLCHLGRNQGHAIHGEPARHYLRLMTGATNLFDGPILRQNSGATSHVKKGTMKKKNR